MLLQNQQTGLTARNQKVAQPPMSTLSALKSGGFFVLAARQYLYGRAVRESFGAAGFLLAGLSTRTVPSTILTGGGRIHTANKRYLLMKLRPTLTLNPSRIRAIRYRRKAYAALRSDLPLCIRLDRFNQAMAKARALEAKASAASQKAQGGAQ